ncbi:MAG: hypothetical protein QHH75_04950 [Bacillota bacterium]|nr:hypothetical protein [Bacillota bacterium]
MSERTHPAGFPAAGNLAGKPAIYLVPAAARSRCNQMDTPSRSLVYPFGYTLEALRGLGPGGARAKPGYPAEERPEQVSTGKGLVKALYGI